MLTPVRYVYVTVTLRYVISMRGYVMLCYVMLCYAVYDTLTDTQTD